MIAAALPLVLILCAGCAGNRIVLYPIEGTDIEEMKALNPYTPAKDGWFVSKFYMDKIIDVKVEDR